MIFVFDIILLVPNTISKSLYVSINNLIYENPQYKQINTWCMIERICHIDNELEDSIFLFGARQTWKSTFLRQSIPYVFISPCECWDFRLRFTTSYQLWNVATALFGKDNLLGFRVPAYTKTMKRRLVQAPRFYYFDIGVANHLLHRKDMICGNAQYLHF